MEALAVAAATPEIGPHQPHIYAVPDADTRHLVVPVENVEFEAETQIQFQKWLGGVVVEAETTENISAETANPEISLLESIRIIADQDKSAEARAQALKMVEANIATAVAEACFKNNHVTTAVMRRGEDGQLIQFNQKSEIIQRNAITERPNRHEVLRGITEAEALNAHRIQAALDAGMLKDHYFVAVSLVPENVPEEELGHKGDGYFLEDLTFVIQATTENEDSGTVPTKTGFLSGVDALEDETFEERIARRYDFKVLEIVFERLGLKSQKTAEGYLKNGAYISKDLMPNGVVDFMRWCAEAKNELDGKNIQRTIGEFMAIELESKRREASLADVRQRVKKDLLAVVDDLEKPIDASKLLWQLVKEHATEDAFTNMNIDPRVFGRAAAPYIIQVRNHAASGLQPHQVEELKQLARKLSEITGCGGGAPSERSDGDHRTAEQIAADEAEIANAPHDKYGSRKFVCKNGHMNTRKENELLEKCQKCKVSVRC